MCPLIYQPTNAVSLSVLLSTQSWKIPVEVKGIQDTIVFKKIVALHNIVVSEVQILPEYLEILFYLLFTILSLTLPFVLAN